MKTKLDSKINTHVLAHRHGGSGWIFIQDLGDNYVRVIGEGVKTLGRQAFLAYKPMLSVDTIQNKDTKLMEEKPIPKDLMPAVNTLREKLASGTLVVSESWIRPA